MFAPNAYADQSDRSNAYTTWVCDQLFNKINSNDEIKNSLPVRTILNIFQIADIRQLSKVLQKKGLPKYIEPNLHNVSPDDVFLLYLQVWIIMYKIRNMEENRYNKYKDGQPKNKKEFEKSIFFSTNLLEKRNARIIDLTCQILEFLDKNYLSGPKSNAQELNWRANDLDEWYHAYEYWYLVLRNGKTPISKIIEYLEIAILQTKKDAAEAYGVTMDDINHLLKPFFDEYGNLKEEKACKIAVAVNAYNPQFFQYGYASIVFFTNLALERLKNSKKVKN